MVMIEDLENPVAICQDIFLQLDGSGNASIGNFLDGIRLFPMGAQPDVLYVQESSTAKGSVLANDHDANEEPRPNVAPQNIGVFSLPA